MYAAVVALAIFAVADEIRNAARSAIFKYGRIGSIIDIYPAISSIIEAIDAPVARIDETFEKNLPTSLSTTPTRARTNAAVVR